MLKAWYAHEVYVLTPSEVRADEHSPKVRLLDSLSSSNNLKFFILFVVAISLFLLLSVLIKSRSPFKRIGAFLDKCTAFAPDFIRVVFGVSLIFSAQHQAVFGPELPTAGFSYYPLITPFLYICGVALIIGIKIRLFAILTAIFWLFTLLDRGWYMLNYLNYFGEALAMILLYRQKYSLDYVLGGAKKKAAAHEQWSMPVARILFGFSILYAAINVKVVTTALSLDVAQRYELSRYFHFDPLFIVLGAAFVESLIGILYILGLARRLNSIVFVTFITLSILFFKESVWPHYLLLGLAIGILLHKPDVLALDKYLPPKRKR